MVLQPIASRRSTAAILVASVVLLSGCQSVDPEVERAREEARQTFEAERAKRWAFLAPKPEKIEAPPGEIDQYKAALENLRELRQRLDATQDRQEATLLLDEMSRTILEARRALWERGQDDPDKR